MDERIKDNGAEAEFIAIEGRPGIYTYEVADKKLPLAPPEEEKEFRVKYLRGLIAVILDN